jgi:phytanoyl-CoA hydroxylase
MQIVATKYQNPLAEDLVKRYREDGVVVLKGFFTSEGLAAVRRELARYSKEIAPKLEGTEVFYEKDGVAVRNLWRMETHDAWFREANGQITVLPFLKELLNGEPVSDGVETFSKPARVGSAVPPHQDNAYFALKPGDALTVWVAIDAVTKENGPVNYVKGSHKAGVMPHRASGVIGNSIGLSEEVDRKSPDLITPLLEPGDAMIHHCETVHFSEPNVSENPRLGFLAVYHGAHTVHDSTLKARYDEARKNMMAAMKIG